MATKSEYLTALSNKDGIVNVGKAVLLKDNRPALSTKRNLTGKISISGTSLTGSNTLFNTELSQGDIVSVRNNPSKYHKVTSVTNDTTAEVDNLDSESVSSIDGAAYDMNINLREYRVDMTEVNDPDKTSPDSVHHVVHLFSVVVEGGASETALANNKTGYRSFYNVNDIVYQAITDHIENDMSDILAYHIQSYNKDQKVSKIKVIEDSTSATEKWYVLYKDNGNIVHKGLTVV